MQFLVIGGSGTIGTGLVDRLRRAGREVVATSSRGEASGTVRFDMADDDPAPLMAGLGPEDCVFLLAAKTRPDWIADNPGLARRVNVEGSARVIEAAAARGAHVVFLSSETVFSEDRETGYGEDEMPAPTTEYGRQKVEIEELLGHGGGPFTIVRTGWVVAPKLGVNCPVEMTYKALLSGTARMATDNLFTLTELNFLVNCLCDIAEGRHVGILHVVRNPPIVRTQLCDWIMHASERRAEMTYERVAFRDLSFREPRARCAWLDGSRAQALFAHRAMDPEELVRRKVRLIEGQGRPA